VSATTPALVAAAAGVGLGHAILPDHWVPLGVISRTRRYPLARVARLAGLAGVAHVAVSLLIGAVIVIVGLQLRSTVEHIQNAIVGGLLIATGLGFALLEATGHGHSHAHDHDHDLDHVGDDHDLDHADDDHDDADHAHDHGGHAHAGRGRGAFMVSFGAAASPDLTILPVFLAATTAGAGAAIASLVAFAVVTVTTIVALTLLATIGGYGLRSHWLERWGNAFTALVLVIVGVLVLTGTI
jgi:nickel/cobalt transporter (NicO) family protein